LVLFFSQSTRRHPPTPSHISVSLFKRISFWLIPPALFFLVYSKFLRGWSFFLMIRIWIFPYPVSSLRFVSSLLVSPNPLFRLTFSSEIALFPDSLLPPPPPPASNARGPLPPQLTPHPPLLTFKGYPRLPLPPRPSVSRRHLR